VDEPVNGVDEPAGGREAGGRFGQLVTDYSTWYSPNASATPAPAFWRRHMTARLTVLIVAGALTTILLGHPVLAHHSFTMFDMDRDVTYKGVVVEYTWVNPHVHITVDIRPGPGVDPATVGTWDVEGGSTNIMGRQGWTRATLKLGQEITFVGHPMRDGSKGVSLFYMIRPDGKRLYHDIARPKGEEGK
jgi:hypothetical protein